MTYINKAKGGISNLKVSGTEAQSKKLIQIVLIKYENR